MGETLPGAASLDPAEPGRKPPTLGAVEVSVESMDKEQNIEDKPSQAEGDDDQSNGEVLADGEADSE
ncbi:MAG TPA: hypothetical protein VN200_06220 [Rhodoglobus sp.]|nr:hypothetical protein [Rhodoglobus sp.]